MKFKKIDERKDIPFKAKETLQALGGTMEEFVDFVSDKVENEGKEMDFYQNGKIAYAYFQEEDTIYVHITDDSPDPTLDGESKVDKKDKSNVGTSHLFTKGLMVFLLILSSFLPNSAYAAGYFSGSMQEDSTVYTGLSKAKFTTPTGSKVIPGFLNTVKSKVYQDTAFTFGDPNRIQNQPSVNLESLPDGANEDLVIAILAYRQKFNLSEIASSTGINVTQRQLDEATQLAIWIHASSVQVNYQIDANSITDTAVRSLATEITTWATQQANTLTEGDTMGNFLFPLYKPTLDASKAKMNKAGEYVEYGPYTVTGQKSAQFVYGVLGGVLIDSSKKQLKQVTASQQFYARFPASYTGDKAIRLKGRQLEYSLNYGQGRLWLDKAAKPVELQFTVGASTGTNGLIQVTAKDSLTNKPVQGVEVEISTSSPLTTVQTDDVGTGEYNASIGKYTLKFTVPEGYMTPPDQEVEVGFAGDIQQINLSLSWSKAVVNFHAVNAQSLAPAGSSEAFIYDSTGKAVKRVALNKGKVSGVVLPEGDYNFVQYKTSDGYAINIGTPFKAVAGKVSDISITQDPNVLPTTITIEGASSDDTWVYTLSSENKVLFKMNGKNALSVPLPSGKYSVMAQKSDGTVTAGPLNFSTVLNGKTDVTLKQEKGTENVTFTLVDTNKKKPIPNVVLGVFDENHNLLTYKTASEKGVVTFENLSKYSIYYVNVLAAPDSVSGYFANGNRFLAQTRDYQLELYSLAEIQKVTKIDTLYRVPNVTYGGTSYDYPK
ncbi:collagen binding domain-containing protein [Lysinibacillus xylanilyticus]|uniref:hypothetical protein n=1 Tax=Lysinibacillus xylanilyticus TaxID=582475 RepID=UPI0036DF4C66